MRLRAFQVFGKVTDNTKLIILVGWLAFFLSYWTYNGYGDTKLFPSIPQVYNGLVYFWKTGLITHVFSSLALCFKSLFISVLISMLVVYLSPIPVFYPLAKFISKLRYLPLTGISFYISILVSDGRSIQVWILVLFMTTFLTTSLLAVLKDIPEEEFNHARTLGCSKFETLLEVVIKGRIDYVIESIRQNFAMIWFGLVTVESILASSGGIGFLIKNSDKFMNHGRIVALQLIILVIGILLDEFFNFARKLLFRFSNF